MTYSIPRSYFLGVGDGSWTDEDRAYALAWQQYRNEMCGGCGHDLTVSTAKHNQFAYEAEIVRCHSCAAKERAAQKFQKDGGEAAGAMTRMKKFPRT